MIEASIIASTKEGYTPEKQELFVLGGKLGGECYMEGRYSDPAVSSDSKGLARALTTSKSGHHSVFDPEWVSIELLGISKMGAMILNSLGLYSTQEKSARYTKMKPKTELEEQIYKKWIGKFSQVIGETYPDMLPEQEDSESEKNKAYKAIEKLAQENARYAISVFTPTSMVYSTSLRQWNYILDWLEELKNTLQVKNKTEVNSNILRFNSELINTVTEITEAVKELVYEETVRDNKGRKIELLTLQTDSHQSGIVEEQYGDSYTAIYKGSVAQLAQAHRHKTLDYIMKFNGDAKEFIVPAIIIGTEHEAEWLEDMRSIAYCVPQGTLVTIIEQGTVHNFILKAQERLCGRAQLEIAEQTAKTLYKLFMSNNVNEKSKEILGEFVRGNEVLPRCATRMYTCTEGCRWGAVKGLKRKI